MKSCLTVIIIIFAIIIDNVYCFAAPQQVYRYWTCYNKKSKIDTKHNQIYCVNCNTYMNESNDKCIVIGRKGDNMDIFVNWNKDLGEDMIKVETKTDSKKITRIPWKPMGKIMVNMTPSVWYMTNLKDGENLIIRVESYDGSFPEEEAEFDIGRINEAWNYVYSNGNQ